MAGEEDQRSVGIEVGNSGTFRVATGLPTQNPETTPTTECPRNANRSAPKTDSLPGVNKFIA